jgi:DNA-binding NtrC family response regulator
MDRRQFLGSVLSAIPALALNNELSWQGLFGGLRRMPVAGSRCSKERYAVLIVDDDAMIRELLSLVLTQFGPWRAVCATTSEEALAAAETQSFDLVTSDIGRPGKLNGLEFLQVFGRAYLSVPVVIITGNASADDYCNALRHGAFAFLAKPFRADELLSAAQAAIFRRRAFGRAMRSALCDATRLGG